MSDLIGSADSQMEKAEAKHKKHFSLTAPLISIELLNSIFQSNFINLLFAGSITISRWCMWKWFPAPRESINLWRNLSRKTSFMDCDGDTKATQKKIYAKDEPL